MAFDDQTRRRLFKTVTACRNLLTEDFDDQLRGRFGIYADEGRVLEIDRLPGLDDAGREVAGLLRERIDHLAAGKGRQALGEAVHRLRREQAFTVLNRFAAVRMAEERDLISQSVGGGFQSRGFRVFEQAAGGTALGELYDRYRIYLDCLFDELSLDLGVLFDRSDAMGLLFPGEQALRALFDELNHPDIAPLWAEDETIGWIYQYYNDPEERKRMRKESAAPRNSRELAVRNQFFTPRYVVEFLTDNALGRIWYEMTKGKTRLADQCRYLVRRPLEFFLPDPEHGNFPGDWSGVEEMREFWRTGDPMRLPENPHTGVAIEWMITIAGDMGFEHFLPMFDIDHQTVMDQIFAPAENGESDHLAEVHPLLLMHCLWRIGVSVARGYGYGDGDRPIRSDEFGGACRLWDALYRKLTEQEQGGSQEELLRMPVFIPPRSLKDPREIRLLDPACGSMHFGLYAFDLFETIYEEAWDNAFCPPLQEAYASRDEFLQDVPRLIIEHNIHGVDIDPRAVQIAGLSLWLRAQKAWKDQGVRAADRPQVRRSNIVCAEPMPGSAEMLEEFVATLDPPLLGSMVKTVFEKMQLAGEAGPLLKIEEEIRTAIDAARKEWLKRQDDLLTPKDSSQEEFFDTAEQQVIDALRNYAERADADSYQRRLFADDAARGFAFIDICRQRYDAVVMNPPFGEASAPWKPSFEKHYPTTKHNLYAAFIDRGIMELEDTGMLGAITSRTGFFLTRFESWRKTLLKQAPPVVLADLGYDVLDSALVETAAFCLRKNSNSVGLFMRLLLADEKERELIKCLNSLRTASRNELTHVVDAQSFTLVPGSPFAYWVSSAIRSLFAKSPSFLTDTRRACITNPAGDDSRYFRCFWEVPSPLLGKDIRWAPIARGGKFSPFYADIGQVVDWHPSEQTYRGFLGTIHRPLSKPASLEYFFKPGITWPLRGARFSAQVVPSGCIFSVAGKFATCDDRSELPVLLGLMSSSTFDFLLRLFGGETRQQFEVGLINKVPVPHFAQGFRTRMSEAALRAVELKRDLDSVNELSHSFIVPAVLTMPRESSSGWSVDWNSRVRSVENEVDAIQRDIDALAFDLYGLSETDRATIHDSVGAADEESPDDELLCDEEEDGDNDASAVAADMLSYSLGTTFGRWDIRYATGERQPPELPDPFDPLPACPPGMLQNADGLPAEPNDVPADYPLPVTWSGILVDDENHPEDIVARVRDALRVVWGERAEDIEAEACEILGVNAKSKENLDALRVYFRDPNRFFKDHLTRYSKSRRKAPIYWPLSTESGSYTLWIYYHRLDSQTLYTCVSDFIDPKREALGREAEELARRIGAGGSSEERQRLEDLTAFQAELKTLRDRLLEVAALPYRPNLNDGVQITASPLWKCFRHTDWQKVLKDTWKDLEKEKYNWAHLTLPIWPARVVAQCARERSLAIAHGLEDLLWVPDVSGKKKDQLRPLKAPEDEIKELIKGGFDKKDVERAAADVAAAEALGGRCNLWIEQPAGTWRRRRSPKEEIEGEVARRKGA